MPQEFITVSMSRTYWVSKMLVIGERVRAVIGERRRHDGEIAGSDVHRALAEIEIEHLVRVVLDHAGVEHHVGDGAVAVAGGQLGVEHRLVDIELAAGEAREQFEHVGDALLLRLALHHLGDRRSRRH